MTPEYDLSSILLEGMNRSQRRIELTCKAGFVAGLVALVILLWL